MRCLLLKTTLEKLKKRKVNRLNFWTIKERSHNQVDATKLHKKRAWWLLADSMRQSTILSN